MLPFKAAWQCLPLRPIPLITAPSVLLLHGVDRHDVSTCSGLAESMMATTSFFAAPVEGHPVRLC